MFSTFAPTTLNIVSARGLGIGIHYHRIAQPRTTTEVKRGLTRNRVEVYIGERLVHRRTILSNGGRRRGQRELVIDRTEELSLRALVAIHIVGRHDTMTVGIHVHRIVLPSRSLVRHLRDE